MRRGLARKFCAGFLCFALLITCCFINDARSLAAEAEGGESRSTITPVMRINLGGDNVPASSDEVNWKKAIPDSGRNIRGKGFNGKIDPVFTELNRSGWIATAFGSDKSDDPSIMLDGNLNTRWAGGTKMAPNQWIEIDMKSPKTISRIIMDSGSSNMDFAREYDVYVSEKKDDWGSPVASGKGYCAEIVVDFTEKIGQYIRVVQKGSDDEKWWSIHEFKVYGQADGTSPVTITPASIIKAPVSDELKTVLGTSVRGKNLEMTIDVKDVSVYKVILHTIENESKGKRVFDVNIQGGKVDTIASGDVGEYIEGGPYTVKAVGENPKIEIKCIASKDNVSVSGIEVYKVTYKTPFTDKDTSGNELININKWYYIPVMELWSRGIISGYTDGTFRPEDNIIGEHVAYMLYNVMKLSINENDPDFDTSVSISDLKPNFWGYNYIRSYYNYFLKEKMSKKIPGKDGKDKLYSTEEWKENIKVSREEFAMAMVGARRLDYNEGGKVFVYDPDREPELSKLNNYKGKGKEEITDNFRYFVELALEKGLMQGVEGGKLNPVQFVTRAQAAQFIFNALNLTENNFIKPDKDYIPAPRITKQTRPIYVGILILPAAIEGTDREDPNPDFTIMELLDRNINKPMDWDLVNPHPPAFDKSEFEGLLEAPYTNLKKEEFNSISSLEELAKAQTDLEADIHRNGVTGDPKNRNKSKFFKYWEVDIQDESLKSETIAKNYDILFQTSHGSIEYSDYVEDKVWEFLANGGQLWWENCSGLKIKSDIFSDPDERDKTDNPEKLEFKDIRPGSNIKFPQVAQKTDGEVHPLLDSIYTISQTTSTRVSSPGYSDKSSPYYTELSMLGDTEEWANDDNRYLEGIAESDTIVLNLLTYPGTAKEKSLPSCIVREINNLAYRKPNGRIVATSSDLGCAISKNLDRTHGKAVEDYKFCYNLFGWMSKVAVNFDDTDANSWDGTDYFTVKANVINYGARAQIYNLTPTLSKEWEIVPLSKEDRKKYGECPWVVEQDDNGYPSKIKLESNVVAEIDYNLKVTRWTVNAFDFALKADEAGVLNSRDYDEDTFTLIAEKVQKPEIVVGEPTFNCTKPNIGYDFSVNILSPFDTSEGMEVSSLPANYELSIKIEDHEGNDVNIESILDSIYFDKSIAPDDDLDYTWDTTDPNVLKIKVDEVAFENSSQKLKFKITLENLINKNYTVIAEYNTFDPVTLAKRSDSDPSDEQLPLGKVYEGIELSYKLVKINDNKTRTIDVFFEIPQYTDEENGGRSYIEIYENKMAKTVKKGDPYKGSVIKFDILAEEASLVSDKNLIGLDSDVVKIPMIIEEHKSENGKIKVKLTINAPFYGDINVRVTTRSKVLDDAISSDDIVIYGVDIQ